MSVRPFEFAQCLVKGHTFGVSRSRPGYLTCNKCRARKRDPAAEPPPARLAQPGPARGPSDRGAAHGSH
jgi:hypothetical protein